MKITRKLSLLLAIVMLATFLVACKKGSEGSAQTTGGDTSGGTVNTSGDNQGSLDEGWETDENGYVLDNLDGIDLGGKEIRILAREGTFSEYYVDVEDITASAINSAVYFRHLETQERLNCKLKYSTAAGTYTERAEFANKAQTMAAADEIDLVSSYSLTASNIMLNGLYADLNKSQTLEFDKPWWNQLMVDSCTVYGKMYYASGDISHLLLGEAYAYRFNKDIASNSLGEFLKQNYGVDSLYELVDEGKWTYENMMAIANAVVSNPDGVKDASDTFGYVVEHYATDSFWAGCGLKHLASGADGSIVVSSDMGGEKADGIMTKLQTFFKSNAAVVTGSEYSGISGTEGHAFNLWKAEKALFFNCRVYDDLTKNFDVGVLPVPKYNEEQEMYITCPGFGYSMWGVVRTTTTDYESCCAVLEALASNGYRNTVPAYFDDMFANRQDTVDDYRMLQIVREGIRIDSGRVVDNAFGELTWATFRACVLTDRNYAAHYAKYAQQIAEQAAALNSLMLNMEKLYG